MFPNIFYFRRHILVALCLLCLITSIVPISRADQEVRPALDRLVSELPAEWRQSLEKMPDGNMRRLIYKTLLVKAGKLDQAESWNVSLIAQIGGTMRAIEVSGDYVYVGSGPALFILDVSNPTSPIPVGRVDVGRTIWDIFYSPADSLLFYVDSYGMGIVDVSVPYEPQQLSYLEMPCFPHGVVVRWGRAYVANGDGVLIIAVSDPYHPTEIGFFDCWAWTVEIDVQGTNADVVSGEGLHVVDMSNPSAPAELAYRSVTPWVYDVKIYLLRAYVTWARGLEIFDVTQPGNPIHVGGCANYGGTAREVRVRGELAYVDDQEGFLIINVADATNPRIVGSYDFEGQTLGIAIDNRGYLYAADAWGMRVLNVLDPRRILQVGMWGIPGDPKDVAVRGSSVFVAGYLSGVHSVNLPTLRQRDFMLTLRGSWAVALSNDGYVYAGGDGGVEIFLADEQGDLTGAGSYHCGGTAWGIYQSDSRLFLVGRFPRQSELAGGMLTLDISDPRNPHELSFVQLESTPSKVAIAGNYAYLACGNSGVLIFDISNPESPKKVGAYRPYGWTSDVTVSGSYAYVAAEEGGLCILDVSDPGNVRFVSERRLPGYARGVTADGNLVYVACSEEGVWIIDVSKPRQPKLTGFYNTTGYAESVAVSESGSIVVADSYGGLVFLRYDRRASSSSVQLPKLEH